MIEDEKEQGMMTTTTMRRRSKRRGRRREEQEQNQDAKQQAAIGWIPAGKDERLLLLEECWRSSGGGERGREDKVKAEARAIPAHAGKADQRLMEGKVKSIAPCECGDRKQGGRANK